MVHFANNNTSSPIYLFSYFSSKSMMGSREPNGGLYPNRSYTQHTTQALDKVTTCEPHKSNIRGQNYTKPSNVSRDYEAEHSSEELITHLRIQNAVLESNLKHVTKERDEAINGNILIIKTFSSAIGRGDGDSKIRELKDELNKLQLENKILRQHIKAQRGKEFWTHYFRTSTEMCSD